MNLSDFGSIASIISLIIGLIGGFIGCKKLKNISKMNIFKSLFNFGNISQKND